MTTSTTMTTTTKLSVDILWSSFEIHLHRLSNTATTRSRVSRSGRTLGCTSRTLSAELCMGSNPLRLICNIQLRKNPNITGNRDGASGWVMALCLNWLSLNPRTDVAFFSSECSQHFERTKVIASYFLSTFSTWGNIVLWQLWKKTRGQFCKNYHGKRTKVYGAK